MAAGKQPNFLLLGRLWRTPNREIAKLVQPEIPPFSSFFCRRKTYFLSNGNINCITPKNIDFLPPRTKSPTPQCFTLTALSALSPFASFVPPNATPFPDSEKRGEGRIAR